MNAQSHAYGSAQREHVDDDRVFVSFVQASFELCEHASQHRKKAIRSTFNGSIGIKAVTCRHFVSCRFDIICVKCVKNCGLLYLFKVPPGTCSCT